MPVFSTYLPMIGPHRRHSAVPAIVAWLLFSLANVVGAHERHASSDDLVQPSPAWQARMAQRPLAPAIGGTWSGIRDWPLVAVHAALLPNGKVLAWDATPDDADEDPHTADNITTRVTLWDPRDDSHVETNNDTGTDLFCAGSAHMWDGRILFAGGDSGPGGTYGPLSNSNLYDASSNTWRTAGSMHAPRWYSSVAALANGEMLTWGGGYQPQPAGEVLRFDQTWRALDSAVVAKAPNADYQWIQQIPDGSVLWFGPENRLANIDTVGNGSWMDRGPRDDIDLRDHGSYAHFDVGRILVAGGGESSASAIVIDTATRQASDTAPLTIGRKQHMLTVLADGSVLATGGTRDGERFYSPTGGVLEPEIRDSASGRWTIMNPMQVDRQYHSIALLLPDGRVLSAGGGLCAVCYAEGYEEANAEIFSPPYLFGADGLPAPRPLLETVPATAAYGAGVSVTVNDAQDIDRAHLIKLGSATHSENQDQRLVPLTFERDEATLTLEMPDSRTVAPPGHYLLFVVDRQGVPSHGAMLKLGQPLVAPGQRIRSRVASEGNDAYTVPVTGGRLSVELESGDDIGLALRPQHAAASGTDEVRCRIARDDATSTRCVVDNTGVSQWVMTLSGRTGNDYTLDVQYTSDPPTDVGTTSGSPDVPVGVDDDTRAGSGGGAPSPLLLLMVTLLAPCRRRSVHAPRHLTTTTRTR